MKRLILVAALLPFAVFAQPINTLNNPNQPGYQNPSQQRMQNQMMMQQQQQTGMLNQQLQTQTRVQQQHLQTQLNNNTLRVQQSQPGGQQILPNTSGGMLSGGDTSGGVQQQHMLPQRQNGDLLNNP
ncbi:DUF2756 family protein [Leclercia adecarboxylata]|uniref:DUF2756 family protein n=1 Tax=Leclercia adecarboxylata TaxID=83655 RepID=UPI002DB56DCD|nr:DUF2756 family protein [Leclercia adecarboxylata]MEB6381280.1 DUF2756 family protein [Leclercia adecarboxylata]